MKLSFSYKSTAIACYIGNFTQAIVTNITAIIFIPLREQFNLSYSQFGFLVFINFTTQVLVDVLCSKAVDRHGFRPFMVIAHILCILGFGVFVSAPLLFHNSVYVGFLIGTIIFSGAAGLFELLLSPIVNSLPSEQKSKAMALLHSFYAWGQVTVVLVTTLLLFLGIGWQLVLLFWMIIPLFNSWLFSVVPFAPKVDEAKIMRIRHLVKNPIFIAAFFAILFGGAAEVTMAQWTSSFMQKGLNFPKITGDLLGMCGFAILLGIGRVIYGIKGDKLNLSRVLIWGSALAVVCYITAALSSLPIISLIACIICGFCVSLLWPGTLVIASSRLPLAGASLFALLAAGGDIGAAAGPWLTGLVTDAAIQFNNLLPAVLNSPFFTAEQTGLRIGLLFSALYPVFSFFWQSVLKKK